MPQLETNMTIQVLLYIINKFPDKQADFHKISKIMYFADQYHLAKYGTSISNDDYIPMRYGPVPSFSFDVFNSQKNKGNLADKKNDLKRMFRITGDYTIKAIKEPDLDFFSESELECLNQSYEENHELSFDALTEKSHDSAWDTAHFIIDQLQIAKAGGANKQMIEYIKTVNENKNAEFGWI